MFAALTAQHPTRLMLVQEFLENSAARLPAKEALVAGPNRLTYEALNAMSDRFANALRAGGIEYGDRVAVLMDNTMEAVVSIWGILKAGGIFLVINPSTKTRKISFILNDCRATGLAIQANKLRSAGEAITAVPSLRAVFVANSKAAVSAPDNTATPAFLSWEDAIDKAPAAPPDNPAIDIDLAALIYTSGTTGNPKGVMVTHQNVVAASTSITTYLENIEDDIVLSVLPLSFDYGLYQMIMCAQFGGTLVLEKSFVYPGAVLDRLRSEHATGFPIVPTMSAILLQMKELKPEHYRHVRYLSNTAAALPVKHILGLAEIFRDSDIYSMYGLTECKRVSYLPPADLKRKPTSVGKGMPNEQVYLVDDNNEVITEPDVVGELVVRGANVMQGYWERPEETEKRLRPGRHPWERSLYTGDLFKMDDEGYLYFISRKDDIIKSRGEKVSPKEVEAVLFDMQEVIEAAVVGVPDAVLGEAIKAYVVLGPDAGITDREILAHCRKNLEDFMVPQQVELVKSLPKTSSGKITKKGL